MGGKIQLKFLIQNAINTRKLPRSHKKLTFGQKNTGLHLTRDLAAHPPPAPHVLRPRANDPCEDGRSGAGALLPTPFGISGFPPDSAFCAKRLLAGRQTVNPLEIAQKA